MGIEKLRVLLVQPDIVAPPGAPKGRAGVFKHGTEIPLGLMYISSFLISKDIDSTILDLRIHENPDSVLLDELSRRKPDVVGITAFSVEILGAEHVSALVKGVDPEVLVVIGGLHASALPEETLMGCDSFDFLVHGEGEVTFVELLRSIRAGAACEDLAGIAFRLGEKVVVNPRRELIADLDSLPLPDRSGIDLACYRPDVATFNYLRLPTTGLMASRGCPYDCYHCSKGVWGRSVRFRSAEGVFEEMRRCMIDSGIHDFRFYDDVLTLPGGPIRELCELILREGMDVSFNCYSRIDHITRDLLVLMKLAGCYHVKYGIEFGSERALELSNRQTSLAQARQVVALTREVGIMVKGNFMIGIPGERLEDVEKTISFAREISPDLASFGGFCIFPGSRFYKDVVLEKRTGPDYDMLPKQELLRLIGKAYRRFYFRASYLVQILRLALTDRRRFRMTLRFLIRGSFTLIGFLVRRVHRRA